MRLGYKTLVPDDNRLPNDYRCERLITTVACCKMLERQVADGFVAFCPDKVSRWDKQPKLYIQVTDANGLEPSMDECISNLPIDFCPFCGEAIECLETARVSIVARKVTESVERLIYEEVAIGDLSE